MGIIEFEEISMLSGKNGVTEKIKKEIYNIANSFVYIGFLLWEVNKYEYYLRDGFTDVYDYAQNELGFKKTSVKNFISICENFSKRTESNYPSMFLSERYDKYNYSQLTEMLSLNFQQRALVSSDMTVKKIREIKKGQTSDSVVEITVDDIIESHQIIFEISDSLKYLDYSEQVYKLLEDGYKIKLVATK